MKKWGLWIFAMLIVAGGGFYVWHAMTRNLSVELQISLPQQSVKSLNLSWPDQGRAAVGFANADSSANCRKFGDSDAHPTASIAKMITALVVLNKYPLKGGEDGPAITLTDADVARLIATQSANGSFVRVEAGEQLSERQILLAVMLASANNLADSLAIWAFGSMENYKIAAESWLAQNGLFYTNIGADASGLDSGTTSTASDLCKLMLIASRNSALTEIISTKEIADFPVAGKLTNTNRLLGTDGVIGGKTGFTDEAGYGLIYLAKVDDKLVAIVVLGQDSYDAVFANTQKLLDSVAENLTVREIGVNEKIGKVSSEWGAASDLVTADSVRVLTWVDQKVDWKVEIFASERKSLASGEIVGGISYENLSINVVNREKIASAGTVWRLLHGF